MVEEERHTRHHLTSIVLLREPTRHGRNLRPRFRPDKISTNLLHNVSSSNKQLSLILSTMHNLQALHHALHSPDRTLTGKRE